MFVKRSTHRCLNFTSRDVLVRGNKEEDDDEAWRVSERERKNIKTY